MRCSCPPYDKELRKLSRAGVITIFSLLIAFGAFALSDWKDRVGAKRAEEQSKVQITKLQDINDAQKTTLTNQTEELAGIKGVSAQQAETSSKLTEQAKAQDQLVKDAQNLLKGQPNIEGAGGVLSENVSRFNLDDLTH